MQVDLLDTKSKVTLADFVFQKESNKSLQHQVLVASLASKRQGTQSQKTRGDVAGSTKKLWRQKGTGRARVGAGKDPIRRGGGVAFAASPRSYKQKVNRKMYKGALCCILSELMRGGRIQVISDIALTENKTKALVEILTQYDAIPSSIVLDKISENIALASRNLHKVRLTNVEQITPEFLIGAPKVILTLEACKLLEKRLTL